VLSNTTTGSPCGRGFEALSAAPTISQAVSTAPRSGLLFSSTGVGTVTMWMSLSRSSVGSAL
jgi:hypothetical protein